MSLVLAWPSVRSAHRFICIATISSSTSRPSNKDCCSASTWTPTSRQSTVSTGRARRFPSASTKSDRITRLGTVPAVCAWRSRGRANEGRTCSWATRCSPVPSVERTSPVEITPRSSARSDRCCFPSATRRVCTQGMALIRRLAASDGPIRSFKRSDRARKARKAWTVGSVRDGD